MPKFFVQSNQISGNNIQILGDNVNHIHNVLRKKLQDTIQICDQETGENYIAKIVEIQKDYINCQIEEKLNETTESNVEITLFQGVPKFDKMELIIQKNTEIGVKRIVPVMMERTIVKLNEKDKSKKVERWRKIAEIAAKQSMRDIIPEISDPIKTNEIFLFLDEYDVILVAYENEQNNTLKNEIEKLKNTNKKDLKIGIVIGPEGGIDEKEIEIFKKNGFKIITLGKRILRTETVALNILSIIMYELDN